MRSSGSGKKRIILSVVLAVVVAACLTAGILASRGGAGAGKTVLSSPQSASRESGSEKQSDKAGSTDSKTKSDKKTDSTSDKTDSKKAKSEKSGSSDAGSGSSGGASSGSASASSGGAGSSGSSGSSGAGGSASAGSCTVEIRCDTLVGRSGLSQSVQACVPSGGTVLGATRVTLTGGDTAFDVTRRAASAGGVSIVSANTGMGVYVRGIGGLFEKDAGPQSGWMYRVNGSYPSTSSGDYKVRDGDRVVWVYTCKSGADV